MTIKYLSGNMCDNKSTAIVVETTTSGEVSDSVFFDFKKAFPRVFEDIKKLDLSEGISHVIDTSEMFGTRYVIVLPVVRTWRCGIKQEVFDRCISGLTKTISELEIKSISIPAICCGKKGLKWYNVRLILEEEFSEFEDVDIGIYYKL